MKVVAWLGSETHIIDGLVGESLYTALRRAQLPIMSVCGGRASCGACRIQVVPDRWSRLPAALPTEQRLLALLPGRGESDRLSCQVRLGDVLDGLVIRLKVNTAVIPPQESTP
jgi:ferredoxin